MAFKMKAGKEGPMKKNFSGMYGMDSVEETGSAMMMKKAAPTKLVEEDKKLSKKKKSLKKTQNLEMPNVDNVYKPNIPGISGHKSNSKPVVPNIEEILKKMPKSDSKTGKKMPTPYKMKKK